MFICVGLGRPHRGGNGHRLVDRHRDGRSSIPGHTQTTCTRRCRGYATGIRGLGRALGEASARQTASLAENLSAIKLGEASPLNGLPQSIFTGQLGTTLDTGTNLFTQGMFALEQGVLFTSMILAGMVVAIIEEQFAVLPRG